MGTKLTYSFKTYKIQDQDDGQLKASSNPFAIVIAAAKLALMRQKLGDEKLYISKIELARRLLAKKINKQKINGLFYFLKSYVNFAKPEFDNKFEIETQIINSKNNNPMGVVEILRERMIKELVETTSALKTVEFIITLLKTTDFSISRIATITGVTKAFVTKIKEDNNL